MDQMELASILESIDMDESKLVDDNASIEDQVDVSEVETESVSSEQSLAEEARESVSKAPEVQVSEQKQDAFSKKFAALSRKEKKLLEQERAIKAQASELDKLRQEMEQLKQSKETPKVKEVPWKKKLMSSPLETLEEEGLSFEELTQLKLGESAPAMKLQMRMLKEELEEAKDEMRRSYQAEIEELKKSYEVREEQRRQQDFQRTVDTFKHNIAMHIENDKSELPHLAVEGEEAVDAVYNLIIKWWNENNESLDFKEACKLYEGGLKEKADRYRSIGNSTVKPVSASKPVKISSAPTLSNESSISSKKSYRSRQEEIDDLANSVILEKRF